MTLTPAAATVGGTLGSHTKYLTLRGVCPFLAEMLAFLRLVSGVSCPGSHLSRRGSHLSRPGSHLSRPGVTSFAPGVASFTLGVTSFTLGAFRAKDLTAGWRVQPARHVVGSVKGDVRVTSLHLSSRTVNSAPPSGAFETVKVPPCSVITRWANARPMPWPWVLVVKKGMKIFCK
ncbi:MAG: hypothetical protein QOH42_2030 [Blastocatellia bacterium]|nr:hypothetical protein [Blastocatellia bacterium]